MKYKLITHPVEGFNTFYNDELIDCDDFAVIINENQSLTTAIAHFSWSSTDKSDNELYVATDQYPLGGNGHHLINMNRDLEILTDGSTFKTSLLCYGYDSEGQLQDHCARFTPTFTVSRFYITERYEE